ncbi:MAG: hypothetical protein QM723_18420 [Myxococcaceae bacterium]
MIDSTVAAAIREVVEQEVAAALAPLEQQVAALVDTSGLIERIVRAFGKSPAHRTSVRAKRRRNGTPAAACSIIGCARPPRSKGFCASHYLKYRNLERTRRLPKDWKPHAKPHSVRDIKLPRGRAGAKALAMARRRTKTT